MPAPGWIDALPRDRLIAEFSVWSADLMALGAEVDRIAPHADILHLDVADGVFAPSFLLFPDFVAGLRRRTDLPLHVHLMVDDAILEAQVAQFIEAGADLVSIHVENAAVAERALDELAQAGVAAGMVLRVDTPVDTVTPWLDRLDFVTLLGTEIGVKGQGLAPAAPARLAAMREIMAERADGRRRVLAADGGIREHTVPQLRAAGAESVVLGSLGFGAPDLAGRMEWLASLPGPETG